MLCACKAHRAKGWVSAGPCRLCSELFPWRLARGGGTSTAAKGCSAPSVSRITGPCPHKPLPACQQHPRSRSHQLCQSCKADQRRWMWLWQSMKRDEEKWQGLVWSYHSKVSLHWLLLRREHGWSLNLKLSFESSQYGHKSLESAWETVSSCPYWCFPTGSGLRSCMWCWGGYVISPI